MTLPQKLKRLAAFDERKTKCEAYALTPVGVSMLKTENEDLGKQIIGLAVKLAHDENARLQPLIEALIDCVEAAKLFASFAPKGPVPEGLCPSFYHTLNYADEVKLQERIDAGREALTALEKLSGDV